MRHFLLWMIFIFCFMTEIFAQSIDLMPIQVVSTVEGYGRLDDGSSFRPEYLCSDDSGVDIQSRMGFGFLQDVSIRGGLFEDAGVSLNGIPLNNPQTGHYHLSLPVVSSDIKNADVGLNSQTIDFRLREPRGDEGYIRSAFGNAGFAEQVVSMTKKVGENYHRFSAEGLRTDGLRDNTDGYRLAGSYLFRQRTIEHDAMIYAAVSEKKFGANGAYAAPWYMKEQEYLKQDFLMGSWTFHQGLDFTLKPYFHRTQNTFLLDRDDPSFYRNDHTSYVSGNNFEIADPVSGRFMSLEMERQDIRSTNLGTHNRFLYSSEIGLKPQYDGRWRYEGGVKVAYFDETPLKVLPQFHLGYQVSPFWLVNLKAERTFRQPSFTELYYLSPSDVGNPDLGLQRSDNVEVGISYQADEVWFKSDVFLRRQRDTIDWARNTGDTQYQAVNAGKVDVRGFDVSTGRTWDLILFDHASISYTYLDMNHEKSYDISKYAFDYLRHRMMMKLDSQKGKWSYGIRGVFEYHVDLGQRWLVGVEAAYQVNKDLRLFALGENILDKTYEEFRYIEGDPLFLKAGLEMRF